MKFYTDLTILLLVVELLYNITIKNSVKIIKLNATGCIFEGEHKVVGIGRP